MSDKPTDFDRDSRKEHGRILTVRFAHYCWDWDGMTVDETTEEWKCCTCFASLPPLTPVAKRPGR